LLHRAALHLSVILVDPNASMSPSYRHQRVLDLLAALPYLPRDVIRDALAKGNTEVAPETLDALAVRLRKTARRNGTPMPGLAIEAWIGRHAQVVFGDATISAMYRGLIVNVDDETIAVKPVGSLGQTSMYPSDGRVARAHVHFIDD
jgi:hypothetical protein